MRRIGIMAIILVSGCEHQQVASDRDQMANVIGYLAEGVRENISAKSRRFSDQVAMARNCDEISESPQVIPQPFIWKNSQFFWTRRIRVSEQ
ncbi:MAG TPA: hypothetical protein VGK59_07645 [Ohtaekwangia sp.]